MNEPIEERLAKAMARLEETRNAVKGAEERLRRATATARSGDRSVEITVDAQGHLAEVRFLDGKYRTLGAAQLAASVVEAARRAQADMAQTVLDEFQPLSETQGERPHVEASGVDWDDIFGPLLHTVERGRDARPGASDRLRDEITEDESPREPGR
ncbi:YbaB/EbfC family nucleoid-associated protein [Streptomyces coelicoflavus]|uniref:YbaB/EbfC family nucleoid-associated protein n=1 Tax=Streptomyces coelicoflavus TaxID=285562 RepID=UPI00381579E6